MRRMGGSVASRTPRYDAVARRGSSTATTPRSSAVADEAARPLRQQRGRPGEVDQGEGAASGAVAARLEQGVVGPGEGEAVDRHQRERAARDVDPLPEAERGEEAGGLVAGELLEQPALGQIALEQERVGQLGCQGLRRRLAWPAGW